MNQASLPGMKIAALCPEARTNYQQLAAILDIDSGPDP
jgi:hypothetical protein